jgi:hypothetical protein
MRITLVMMSGVDLIQNFSRFKLEAKRAAALAQGVERGPTCPGVEFPIPARASVCTKP